MLLILSVLMLNDVYYKHLFVFVEVIILHFEKLFKILVNLFTSKFNLICLFKVLECMTK